MSKDLKSSSKNGGIFKKALLLLVFSGIGYVVFLGILVISLLQLFLCVFSDGKNKSLSKINKDLCAYLQNVLSYVTMESNNIPHPF